MTQLFITLQQFIAQHDTVELVALCILLLMSLSSWSLIVSKLIRYALLHQQRKVCLQLLTCHTLADAQALPHGLDRHNSTWYRLWMTARLRREQLKQPTQQPLSREQQRQLQHAIEQGLHPHWLVQERGFTVLASIGACAPFVGLFGTVWSIYRALIALGAGDQNSIAQVAGPVGQALIMTGLGLVVALPAVLGYNALRRLETTHQQAMQAWATSLFDWLSQSNQDIKNSTPLLWFAPQQHAKQPATDSLSSDLQTMEVKHVA